MIRRKRQFVDVAGIMVMPYSFSTSRSPLHANHRNNDGHCRTSQRWHPAASSIGDGGDQAIFDEILAQWGAPKTVLIGTYGDQKCDEGSGEPLAKSHTYVVTSVESEPDEKIDLDNPWHGGDPQYMTSISKDRLAEEVQTVYILE